MLPGATTLKAGGRSHMPAPSSPLPTTHEAIRDLASRDDTESLKTLAEAAAVGDQFLRRTAIEAIGRHPRGRALQVIILGALKDPSAYVVRTACDVVAEWALSEAHEPVAGLLANASHATRQHAVHALDAIWTDADFPMLFRIYTGDPEIDVRRDAARVLRQRTGPADWRTLFDAFYQDALARHRQWACELAEAFADAGILPLLSRLSSDVDGHVRKAASKAIRALSGRE
jgi:HEAT repeat protein